MEEDKLLKEILTFFMERILKELDRRRVEENTNSILSNRREIDVKETDKRKERSIFSPLPKDPKEALKSLLREEKELAAALSSCKKGNKKTISNELRLVREDIEKVEKQLKEELGFNLQFKKRVLKSIGKTVGL